ncbi:hypothetical protein [Bifidobacterium crudilactis]
MRKRRRIREAYGKRYRQGGAMTGSDQSVPLAAFDDALQTG